MLADFLAGGGQGDGVASGYIVVDEAVDESGHGEEELEDGEGGEDVEDEGPSAEGGFPGGLPSRGR